MTSRHLVKSIGFVLAVAAVIAFSSSGLRGSKKDRRAHLSADLTRHQARKTTARQRVIVHGTRRELDLLASRHRLFVVKRMRGAAVVLANSAELGDLSRDVDQLSGDLRVQSSTVISDASTAADQTRAGNALLLGLLGIPGVDGQGIGIAVVDSGIAPHSALGEPRRRQRELRLQRSADDRRLRSRHARRRDHRRQPDARPTASRPSMPAASRRAPGSST